jgi:hypothetical protein
VCLVRCSAELDGRTQAERLHSSGESVDRLHAAAARSHGSTW